MLKPTQQQVEQIQTFFTLIKDGYDDILLHPVIDEKTKTERLAFCTADRETNTIYMLGILFLPGDKLYDRFSFKDIEPEILIKKPDGFLWSLWCKIKKKIHLLWI